ncbi:Nodulin MtN21 /EamA transporter family protein [Tripterygium wilfordii]|uniref:WAT1-related protein n=1 Tax=Tripterygium wilfordii TaxID=458696 RepID=A0A7J7D203_TRIWF|nr:WAT1-related protein At5g40240-like isoform X2 [Tripterygium wilfordii]KAF5740353.1 Nodulin MtN21 /EamA transporter family protein [Tripterygium wilfordii]
MGMASFIWGAAPIMVMLSVECTDVGLAVISKAALTRGMNNFVSVVYYNALATLILLPYVIFHRKRGAPLTLTLLCRFFLLGLIGSSGQMIYFIGVKYSSPTLSSAMGNLIPIFTFALAVIYRMETIDLRRSSSWAKTLGAIVAVMGAFIVTLYKGPEILLASPADFRHQLLFSRQSRWVFGGLLLAVTALLASVWGIVQAHTVKEYPEKMTIVFFFTLSVTIQSAIISFILETNPDSWKLKTSIEVIAIVSQAIFGSLFRISVHTWCLHWKGPVFVSMFRPSAMVIAVVMSVIFLGDTLHLGSIIGSTIIALGFYTVLWGQSQEKNTSLEDEVGSSGTSSQQTPLLPKAADEDI